MTEEPHTPDPDETAPTEPQPPKSDAPPPSEGVRRLTRSSSDKLIGGVSGGLGRYFGVDPILFRIAFVVLTFAGGVGVLAYIGLLAFVPADDDSRPFGQRRDANVIGAVLLGIVVVIILGPPFFFIGPALIPIALLIGIGILLWRAAGGTLPSGDPGRVIARAAIALLIGIAAVGALRRRVRAGRAGRRHDARRPRDRGRRRARRRRPVRRRALADRARARAGAAARRSSPPPTSASTAASASASTGPATRLRACARATSSAWASWSSTCATSTCPPARTKLDLQLGIGHAVVRVPEDACVSSDVQIGAGHAQVLDRVSDGLDVDFAEAAAPAGDQPRLLIDGDLGIGALEVVRGDDPLPSHRDGWWDDRADLGGPPAREARRRPRLDRRRARRSAGSASCCCWIASACSTCRFGYALPAILACVGVILLAAGLDGSREDERRAPCTAEPLRRDVEHGIVAGVCSGVANRLGIDPIILRVAVGAATLAGGTGLIVYLLAWALVPEQGGRLALVGAARRPPRHVAGALRQHAAAARASCCCCASGACGSPTRSSGRCCWRAAARR